MPEYISVLHAYLKAEDDIAAIATADDLKLGMERDLLDVEDGECVDVVQTIPIGESPTPAANIIQLRRARNILLRTRSRENYSIACSLDEAVHGMRLRSEPGYEMVKYDYSNMMTVLKEVIDGGNPLEY